jgi:hypothetical protein
MADLICPACGKNFGSALKHFEKDTIMACHFVAHQKESIESIFSYVSLNRANFPEEFLEIFDREIDNINKISKWSGEENE